MTKSMRKRSEMNIKPIKTAADHKVALAEIDRLWNVEPGTPEGDKLDILITLVDAWEDKHEPIDAPDPIETIKFHMEGQGLTRKDMESFLVSRQRVSDVLNRKRPLSLAMIRKLNQGLGIPAEVLIREAKLLGQHLARVYCKSYNGLKRSIFPRLCCIQSEFLIRATTQLS